MSGWRFLSAIAKDSDSDSDTNSETALSMSNAEDSVQPNVELAEEEKSPVEKMKRPKFRFPKGKSKKDVKEGDGENDIPLSPSTPTLTAKSKNRPKTWPNMEQQDSMSALVQPDSNGNTTPIVSHRAKRYQVSEA